MKTAPCSDAVIPCCFALSRPESGPKCSGQNKTILFSRKMGGLGWRAQPLAWRPAQLVTRAAKPRPPSGEQNRTQQLPSRPAAGLGRPMSSSFKKNIRAQKKDWKEIDRNVNCVWVWVKRRWVTFVSFLHASCFPVGTAPLHAGEAAVCGRLPPRALRAPTPPEAPPSGPEPQPAMHVPQASLPAAPTLASLGSLRVPLAHTARLGQPQHQDSPGSPEMQEEGRIPPLRLEGDPAPSSQERHGVAASVPDSRGAD